MGNKTVLVRRRVRTNIRVVVMAIATIIGLLHSQTSFAQTSSVASAANVLKVSPVRSDIEVQPGASKTVQTVVTNLTKAAITVRPVENDFISGDERGTPALILDANTYAPTHSLKRFMAPLGDVTIPAGQAKTVGVVITVPKTAQAGGYFGAVRFAPTSPDSGGQVNLSASVASLILLTVPGDTVEKLNLTNFDIQQDSKPGVNFSTPDDLQVTFRFENKGNIQLGPFGKLSVKDGKKVIYDADFNNKDPRDMILPDSARRWDIPLNNIGSFGKYTVIGTFTYGKTNQTIEVSKSFWVVPQMLIIGAIVGVVLLIAVIVGIWLLLRGYKRRILRKHGFGGRRR